MRDLVRFLKCVLAIAPCMLVVNGSDEVWLNIIGFAYLFLLVGYIFGNKTAVNRMLKDMEDFEKALMEDKKL